MKTNLSNISKLSIMFLMAFITAALVGCSNDITTENEGGNAGKNPLGKGTVFSDGTDATRTSIDENGLFYWETGDQIWVDENKNGTFSLKSDNSQLATDKRTADFYFQNKTLADGPYNLTYTGNGLTSGTSVTIRAAQSQAEPNNSAHIGTDGDCATATATQQQPGDNYKFTLTHKAHYLVFQPCKADTIGDNWKLMSIEIIDADGKAICGTYPFGMGGLDQANATGTQSQVTLTLGGTNGYLLPNKTAWKSDEIRWCAVIAPDSDGLFRNLKIKYNIKPTGSVNSVANSTFAIVKELTVSSAPNKVTRIRHELGVNAKYSPMLYYMWDAVNPYWYGISNPPTMYGGYSSRYPTSTSDNRWYSTVLAPTPASRSCKDMPNANALSWYAMGGDPRWETDYPWIFEGNNGSDVYSTGVWILKQEHIPGFSLDVSYDGVTNLISTDKNYINTSTSYLNGGRPSSELGKYFFLPSLSRVYTGTLGSASYCLGCYWSSTPRPLGNATYAYSINFDSSNININYPVLTYSERRTGRVVAPGWFK